jgi:hypothetical protein
VCEVSKNELHRYSRIRQENAAQRNTTQRTEPNNKGCDQKNSRTFPSTMLSICGAGAQGHMHRHCKWWTLPACEKLQEDPSLAMLMHVQCQRACEVPA